VVVFVGCVFGVAVALLLIGLVFNPRRPGRVKRMPYESGMDPFHDARRRFDVRFYLLAIAFLVFDVELLFLYPWAVAMHSGRSHASAPSASEQPAPAGALAQPSEVAPPAAERGSGRHGGPRPIFVGGMLFVVLLALGFVYDWRKGVFRWR
jgi:NADH-quinone oxidoreductase subunit A